MLIIVDAVHGLQAARGADREQGFEVWPGGHVVAGGVVDACEQCADHAGIKQFKARLAECEQVFLLWILYQHFFLFDYLFFVEFDFNHIIINGLTHCSFTIFVKILNLYVKLDFSNISTN